MNFFPGPIVPSIFTKRNGVNQRGFPLPFVSKGLKLLMALPVSSLLPLPAERSGMTPAFSSFRVYSFPIFSLLSPAQRKLLSLCSVFLENKKLKTAAFPRPFYALGSNRICQGQSAEKAAPEFRWRNMTLLGGKERRGLAVSSSSIHFCPHKLAFSPSLWTAPSVIPLTAPAVVMNL